MKTRSDFPKAVKVAAFERANGHCESCSAKLFTGKFIYDHRIPDNLGGEPTLENCQVICTTCDKIKYPRDMVDIAKARAVHAKHIGAQRSRNPIRGWRRFNGQRVWASDR